MTNEQIIFYFLHNNMNLCAAAACGILVNIEEESKFDPHLYGDRGTSYGICQWHASRFTRLQNWCINNRKNFTTVEGQLGYLKHELETYYTKVLTKIKSVPDTADGAYQAAHIWCTDFEIPANAAVKAAQRGNSAKDVYWPKYSKANLKESEENVTMATDVNKVLEIALAEVGYFEKASNSQLDDKTANAGYGNFTKYARDLDNISGFYNGKKNGYAWCDIFVDWCFVQAYGVAAAKMLLCQPSNSAGAGCTYSMQYYKQKGQFHSSPKPGDQIFFGSGAESTHTGLVYKVDGNYVYTIEGNTSSAVGVVANGGTVCKKSYILSHYHILGYGRPNYSGTTVVNSTTTKPSTTTTSSKKGVCNVILDQLAKGSKGQQVKSLQLLLIGYGHSCGSAGADGDFGSGTYNAVIAFQKKKKLEADGIVGTKTWNALLKG